MRTNMSRRDVLRLSSIGGIGGLLTLGDQISEPLAEQLKRQQAGKTSGIKITDVEQFQVEIPFPKEELIKGQINSFDVLRIKTTEGITGYAFDLFNRGLKFDWLVSSTKYEKYNFQERLDKVRSIIIGQDPFAIEQFLERFAVIGFETYGIVECALWDIVGKATGMPVHKLLGGNKKKTKYYITMVWPNEDTISPAAQAEDILGYDRQGYHAIKVRAFRKNGMDDVELAKLVMAKASPGFRLMFDRCGPFSGQTWTYEQAYQVAKGMQDVGVYWLEEPFEVGDMTKAARLNQAMNMLITGGDLCVDVSIFAELLSNNVFDSVEPDCYLVGGILNVKKIGAMAQAFNKQCIPHGTPPTIRMFGHLQANAALTNCEYQEVGILFPPCPPNEFLYQKPGLKLLNTSYMFEMDKEYITIPQGAGLGMDINEDALEEYKV